MGGISSSSSEPTLRYTHSGLARGSLQPPRTPGAGVSPCTPITPSAPLMPAKIDPSSRRYAVIPTRVSPAELDDWRAKAKAAGVTVSELIRQSMQRTRTWTAAARAAERERTRQIARIGSNLNQIARWVNTHRDAADAIEVLAGLVAVRRALDGVATIRGDVGVDADPALGEDED